MVKDQASSQFALRLNCPPSPATRGRSRKERSFSHVGLTGALLLERKTVCLTLCALWLPQASEEFVQTQVTFGEWRACLRFSTCVCTNCHFLKTFFLIFDLLPHCILTKGTICKDIGKQRGQLFATERCRICSWGMGQVSTLVHRNAM